MAINENEFQSHYKRDWPGQADREIIVAVGIGSLPVKCGLAQYDNQWQGLTESVATDSINPRNALLYSGDIWPLYHLYASNT